MEGEGGEEGEGEGEERGGVQHRALLGFCVTDRVAAAAAPISCCCLCERARSGPALDVSHRDKCSASGRFLKKPRLTGSTFFLRRSCVTLPNRPCLTLTLSNIARYHQ